MNIPKLLLIITAVSITGIFSAMDSGPLTHKDIILTMMNDKAFSSADPAVDHNGKIYTLTSSSHYAHDYIESFCYRLEKPISSSKILNYKTDIVLFLHFVRTNDTTNDKIKKLSDPKEIKGCFTQTYKINYRNIAKTGIVLATCIALFMSTQS